MNNIRIFQNEQFGQVRIAMNENGEPLFCLADVAKALGYSRPADAVSQHCKGVAILPTPHCKPVRSNGYAGNEVWQRRRSVSFDNEIKITRCRKISRLGM